MHNMIYTAYFLHASIYPTDSCNAYYFVHALLLNQSSSFTIVSSSPLEDAWGQNILGAESCFLLSKFLFTNVQTVQSAPYSYLLVSVFSSHFILLTRMLSYSLFTQIHRRTSTQITALMCDTCIYPRTTRCTIPFHIFLFGIGNSISVRYMKGVRNLHLRLTVLQHDSDTVTSFTSSLHYTFNFYLCILRVLVLRADVELHNGKFETRGNFTGLFGERKKMDKVKASKCTVKMWP